MLVEENSEILLFLNLGNLYVYRELIRARCASESLALFSDLSLACRFSLMAIVDVAHLCCLPVVDPAWLDRIPSARLVSARNSANPFASYFLQKGKNPIISKMF